MGDNINVEYYEVEYTTDFAKNIRRLTKKKQFVNLPHQILELEAKLSSGEFPGILIRQVDLPEEHKVYKLRLPNLDAKVGKSDGYRLIYTVFLPRRIVVLLTIYYKKEQESVTETYIKGLIDGFLLGEKECI